jgi:tRNA-Thr(GGU) m(6)t(6)A37 methyltransferase TsaA
MNCFRVKSIGIIHSPYKTKEQAPRQGGDDICEIEIFGEYEQGLEDIETFSHLHVFYWLHQAREHTLSVTTPWDDAPRGLFATRTPNRPNPLGHAVVQLLERRKNVLKVRGGDAIDGTPVVDIKPYIPRLDARTDATKGWLP